MRSTRGPILLLAVVLGTLALFVNKAFTIDDTLFVWLGEHLREEPLDFFRFRLNWNGWEQWMYAVTKNPPLAGYYLALSSALFGRSEVALHAAFLLPAACAALGTYYLAARLCTRPLAASLIGLMTPVFLVSSSNVMCDTLMLAFFTWSVWLWMRGLDRDSLLDLALAALLAALAGLTKYFGIALVPLLFAYAVHRRRSVGSWALPLLLPVAILGAYELVTASLYGRGMILEAGFYASSDEILEKPGLLARSFTGLVFAGGCLISLVFFAPLLFSRRVVCAGALLLVLLVAGLLLFDLGALSEHGPAVASQRLVMACGGLVLLVLAWRSWWAERNSDTFLLLLWVFGTFAFATYVNWVNNGRSNLPLAPVAGILVVRGLETRLRDGHGSRGAARLLAFAPGLALALLATWSDYRWANLARDSALQAMAQQVESEGSVYFAGHWGFQYYMEERGARPLDLREQSFESGDLLVLPNKNTGLPSAPKDERAAELLDRQVRREPFGLHTWAPRLGASFYGSNLGPMPWAIGETTPDVCRTWRIKRQGTFTLRPRATAQ